MISLNLKSLVQRLSPICRAELENAAGFALMRTNFNIEIEHWLKKIIDNPQSDVRSILNYFNLDQSRIDAGLSRSLDRLKTGNTRPPGLSPSIVDLIKQTWLLSTIELSSGTIRSSHLFMCCLADDKINLAEISDEFSKISFETLKKEFVNCTAGSSENQGSTFTDPQLMQSSGGSSSSGEALAQFTLDLVEEAKAGRIDPILGRDEEIRQIIDILSRRRQNNPILAGEAGVGKTAVVEGFALRIASKDVPPSLQNVSLRSLDLGLMQAGASVKGEFEKRLRAIIDEVKASPQPVILFIDEAHTLVGAGGAPGMGDAANLLKPALARGELRTIAATTWAEYKKYFEKDAALARRFQVIKIEEPDESRAVAMIRGLVPVLEKSHSVRIVDEAVRAAVELSARYIPSRQLPDKAVSVIDTACARVSVSQSTIPAAIADKRQRLSVIAAESAMLEREALVGSDNHERQKDIAAEEVSLRNEIEALEQRWDRECEIVKGMALLRSEIESSKENEAESADFINKIENYEKLRTELSSLQQEKPLVHPLVDKQAIAEVVQNWTGIPTGKMQSNQINSVLNMRVEMENRIVGQSHAIVAVSQAIMTSRAGLTDPRKPVGVFLMVGPSGVGKTETALTIADLLYGGENSITTINMSEFKEEHKVSLLMGSPPGYVGYGEGGVLTEAVRRKPHSVILLDEMEKAHPGVQDVFFQVFDKGHMRDGEGRDIDFKNSLIIMTSNACSDLISQLCADPDTAPEPEELAAALKEELRKHFKDAFLGRVNLVPYLPLSTKIMKDITVLQLNRIRKRLLQSHRVTFNYDDDVIEDIVSRCRDSATGARNIENILTRSLLPDMSSSILESLARGEKITSITVGQIDNRYVYNMS